MEQQAFDVHSTREAGDAETNFNSIHKICNQTKIQAHTTRHWLQRGV